MIITIHQPEHLPWLGFFNKMSKAEVFVILDSVQYRKNYFQNRNRIMGSNGPQFITIPTRNKGHMELDIAHTEISTEGANAKWKDKYLRTIQMSYVKHPYFAEVYPVLEAAILPETELLCEVNTRIFKAFAEKLDIRPAFVRSSEMDLAGAKSDLILDICRKLKTDVYIAGPSGRDYLDIPSFTEAGITVKYNDYTHPVYPQRKTKAFESHLAALDLFMNCGWEEGKRIMMNGNEGLSDQ